jgi:hypothetical protein
MAARWVRARSVNSFPVGQERLDPVDVPGGGHLRHRIASVDLDEIRPEPAAPRARSMAVTPNSNPTERMTRARSSSSIQHPYLWQSATAPAVGDDYSRVVGSGCFSEDLIPERSICSSPATR